MNWEETFHIILKNPSEDNEIEIVLLQKNFLQSDNVIGSYSFKLTIIKESYLKDWCYLYPIHRKKYTENYNDIEPNSELLISIELIYTSVNTLPFSLFSLIL